MPSQDRSPRNRRSLTPSEAGPVVDPALEPAALEPVRAAAVTRAPTVAHVAPIAETMGNSAAVGSVQEWARSGHGGPQNPDDPDDLWYWQHKNKIDWDYDETGRLKHKGERTTTTDDGATLQSSEDVGASVRHERKGGNRKTTFDGHVEGAVDRTATVGDTASHDSASGGVKTRVITNKAKDGTKTRSSDTSAETHVDLVDTVTDGATVTETGWHHDGTLAVEHASKDGAITSSAATGGYEGAWDRTATTTTDTGKHVDGVEVHGGLSHDRLRNDDNRDTTKANLGASHTVTDVATVDGVKTTDSNKTFVDVSGKRDRNGDGPATYDGRAKIGYDGKNETVRRDDDGTKVTTTLTHGADATGTVDRDAKGRLGGSGNVGVEGRAEREWARKRDDGATVTDVVGVEGRLEGDAKRSNTGKVDVGGSGKLGVDAKRTIRATDDDGSKVVTKVGGAVGASGDVWKEGKNKGEVHGNLSAERERTRETETGSLTTNYGGSVEGKSTAKQVAGGVDRTHEASATLTAGRSATDKTETGTVTNEGKGEVVIGTTVDQRADGRTGVVHNASLGTQLGRTTVDEVGDTKTTTKIGAGGEVRGSRGTNADGEAVRTYGGEVSLAGERKTVVSADDGSKTTTGFKGGVKAGGDVERVGDKLTQSANGELTLGASRAREFKDGDVAVTDTLSGDFKGKGKLKADGSASGEGTIGLTAEQKREWEENGRQIDTTQTQGGTIGGSLARAKDGTLTHTENASVALGTERRERYTDAAGVKHLDKSELSGEVAGERSAEDRRLSGQVKWGGSEQTTTTNKEDGTKVVHKVGDTVTGKADVGKKTGADGLDYGASTEWKRKDETSTTSKIAGGEREVTTGTANTIGTGWRNDKGASLKAGKTWTNETVDTLDGGTTLKRSDETSVTGSATRDERKVGVSRTDANSKKVVNADGSVSESSASTTKEAGLSTKKGLTAGISTEQVEDKTSRKLGEHTTLTTTTNEIKAGADAGLNRDKNGNLKATASANASATAFQKDVAFDNKNGLKAQAGVTVGKAEANATGSATLKKDQLKVGGSAGAKLTLVGGAAKAEVPVFTWSLLGEPVRVKLTVGLNAAVVAEAQGDLNIDVGRGDKLGVDISAGGRAFAGAKAGVEVGAHLTWLRRSDYHLLIKDFLDDVPGVGRFVNDVPEDLWKQVANMVIGTGESDLLIAKAGVFGSAGIGGEASFGLSLKGGRVKMNGDLNGAIGIGGGAKTSLDLDAIDGIRFGGVLALRGMEWIKDVIAGAGGMGGQLVAEGKRRVDAWMEEKKKAGGVSGFFAKSADWLGDDVFDLW